VRLFCFIQSGSLWWFCNISEKYKFFTLKKECALLGAGQFRKSFNQGINNTNFGKPGYEIYDNKKDIAFSIYSWSISLGKRKNGKGA
jgi:hypothetical protein